MNTRRTPRLAVNPIAYGLALSARRFSSALDETVEMVCALDPARRVGMSSGKTEFTKQLWSEPGDGVVDFDAVLAAMPDDDGGYITQVDEPSIDDRCESSRRSREWATRVLSFPA